MKKFYLLFLIVGVNLFFYRAYGVTCSPTSCSPGCDSSCSYQVCEMAGSVAANDIKILPYTTITPSDACNYSPTTITEAPFDIPNSIGGPFKFLPVVVSQKYKTCVTKINNGPVCPPPPGTP